MEHRKKENERHIGKAVELHCQYSVCGLSHRGSQRLPEPNKVFYMECAEQSINSVCCDTIKSNPPVCSKHEFQPEGSDELFLKSTKRSGFEPDLL